ncbi:hypothetical protein [Piscirickettsia salmonis]|nr:hypothetical protein [Piscirickettsia salmonis]
MSIDGQPILDTYKKRWSIEEFHKSVTHVTQQELIDTIMFCSTT